MSQTIFRFLPSCLSLIVALYCYHIYVSKSIVPGSYTNWDGMYTEKPSFYHQPRSVDELVTVIKLAHKKSENVKVIGAHHSWSSITCIDSNRTTHLVNLDLMSDERQVTITRKPSTSNSDHNERNYEKFIVGTATVPAGMRLKDLLVILAKHNLTIAQVGSIIEQSVAGVMSTATHGSSLHIGIIASLVKSLDLVVANGTIIHMDEFHPYFKAALVSLGALGVITRVELKVMSSFHIHMIETPIDANGLNISSEFIRDQHYTKIWYLPHTGKAQLYTHHRLPEQKNQWSPYHVSLLEKSNVLKWLDNTLINGHLIKLLFYLSSFLPNAFIPTFNTAIQSAWVHKEHVDSSYTLLAMLGGIPIHREAEYSVPFKYWKEAFHLIRKLEDEYYLDFITEFRFVKGDDIWMSPAHGRDSMFITLCIYGPQYTEFFTRCKKEILELMQLIRDRDFKKGEDEAIMYSVRPHWGKTHYLRSKHLRSALPHFDDFIHVREKLDPTGMFMNQYLRDVLYN
jgi:hypothetical protein